MAQYATPQFIDEPGKIIFFLTFKQFGILVAGLFASIGLYLFLPFIFFLIGAAVVMGTSALIAFFKINNMSVVKVFMNFMGYMIASKNYTWKKKENVYPFNASQSPKAATTPSAQAVIPQPMKMQQSKLKEIKKLVETKK